MSLRGEAQVSQQNGHLPRLVTDAGRPEYLLPQAAVTAASAVISAPEAAPSAAMDALRLTCNRHRTHDRHLSCAN